MERSNKKSLFVLSLVCFACSTMNEGDAITTNSSSQSLTPAIKGQRVSISFTTPESITNQITSLKQTSRFVQLQEVLKINFLVSPDLSKTEGQIYSLEENFLVVPLVNINGSNTGHIVISQEIWAVGITRDKIPTGYLVNSTGTDIIKLKSSSIFETFQNQEVGSGDSMQLQSSMSCQYAASVGLNIGCINLKTNPLGYYYDWTTRVGYGDPSSPQWWACFWGNIHVCPQYEYEYSPIVIPTCGYPPVHPAG
jgi:hypothetical protein